jgi:hypothetical protein
MKHLMPGFLLSAVIVTQPALACDLCAVYGVSNAQGESSGFIATVAGQFVAARDLQFDGKSISVSEAEFLDSSIIHFVPGYNFTPRVGLSLNVPLIYRSYRLYDLDGPSEGHVSGLGDISLIGRLSILQQVEKDYSVRLSLLGGVKLPTGDADLVKKDVEQEVFYSSFFPPGHGHAISGVHLHDLALGSGSVDGIVGTSLNLRRKSAFFTTEFQYYIRTEGESSFKFGNDLMVSGGPGYFLLLKERYSASLQLNAAYETKARAEYFGRKSNQTGMTAWYLGPQLGFTFGSHFSARAGVDIPLRVESNGLQSVPDYRIHGSFAWSF